MATYTKLLKTITITTTSGGQFIVEDTTDCPAASSALASLNKGTNATIKVGDDIYLILANAVDNIKIETNESEEIPMPDPSC